MRATCLAHFISLWLDNSNYIWWTAQVMKILIMQFAPAYSWIRFWFVTAIPKYIFLFSTLSKDLLATFISWFSLHSGD
jgi:hypothetical protein